MNTAHPFTLPTGRKTSPIPFLATGWEETGSVAVWPWATQRQATLHLDIPPSDSYYFMAEVSALAAGQADHPQAITLFVNSVRIDEWIIDSATIHDKLLIIPSSILQPGMPNTITFCLQSPSSDLPLTAGMQLHTISLDTNLQAYLDELQTGYQWVCGIRNELLDTIRRVLFFLDNIDNAPEEITAPLQKILQDPYAQAQHQTKIIFDEAYFQKKLPHLKEGRIHQAIRQWQADLQRLMSVVISAGNFATRQPEIRCWSQQGLVELIDSPQEFSEKIAQVRAKNITLNNLEILLHRERIDSVPPVLYLDITNRCNFRCRMCYQSTSHFLRQNLINDHMAIVVDMVPYLTEITVAGLGEPLLSKNLLSLAERANTLHCHTSVITNGSLIPANLHILKHFSTVSISFDGAEAKTFEALRNRSNFKQILNNIKKLRNEAPAITIALSVVLSRANLDELSGIVQWAADLGVNVVNVTPLEHMPAFELQRSDFPLFQTQLATANRLAEQAGITLSVAIGPQNFSDAPDTPRDKKAIIDTLLSMTATTEHETRPETISRELQSSPFNYYPNPVVIMQPAWPMIADWQRPEITHPLPGQQAFDIDRELCRLDENINDCLREIRQRPSTSFSTPYCLAPWKLNYVKSNGTSRLCCHTDFIVGDLGGQGFKAAIDNLPYRQIRQSMTGKHPLLPVCKKCRAADRALALESINDTCRAYGIPFTAEIPLRDNSDAG